MDDIERSFHREVVRPLPPYGIAKEVLPQQPHEPRRSDPADQDTVPILGLGEVAGAVPADETDLVAGAMERICFLQDTGVVNHVVRNEHQNAREESPPDAVAAPLGVTSGIGRTKPRTVGAPQRLPRRFPRRATRFKLRPTCTRPTAGRRQPPSQGSRRRSRRAGRPS